MRIERKDGYKSVGELCTPFDTDITLEQANALRTTVVWDFFENMPVKTPAYDETSDKTMAAKAFHDRSFDRVDELPSVFAGVVLRHIDAESWRMIIMQTKLRRARYNNAQQRIETRLNIEVLDGRLVEAIRKVRIVRGVGELTVAAIEHQMEEDVEDGYVVMQRRAYERKITPDDCDKATEFLHQTVDLVAGR